MLSWLKGLCCRMGWHAIDRTSVHTSPRDPLGFLRFARCRWCGYEGQVDGQGNLF